ncbi:MAG: hypothetical protein IT373_08685, partial [Polyangiaceae bacterium]|nr:hypothetical protein [Polyangiaceae bacterium]
MLGGPADHAPAPQPVTAPAAGAVAPSRAHAALSVADFVFRLAYFLVIPVVLFFTSLVFPLTGAFVNMGLLVLYFLVNPLLRPLVARRPWLAKPLKKFMAFEAYYRENPPRTFAYYVFFPLLFPYWLLVKRPRREFLLFRGLSLVALLILIGLALLQYFTKWAPDIGFGAFAQAFGLIFLIQGFIVLTFLMPLATTVISYQHAGKTKRLVALFLAMTVATSAAVIAHAKRRHGTVPVMTVMRIGLRTAASPDKAAAALRAGVEAAIQASQQGKGDQTSDLKADVAGGVEVVGPVLEAAQAGLATYYKADEAQGFLLAKIADPRAGVILALYAVDSAGKPIIWLAVGAVAGKLQILPGSALAPESVDVM